MPGLTLEQKGVERFRKGYRERCQTLEKDGVKSIGRVYLPGTAESKGGEVPILVLPTRRSKYVEAVAGVSTQALYSDWNRTEAHRKQPQRKFTLGQMVQLKESKWIPTRNPHWDKEFEDSSTESSYRVERDKRRITGRRGRINYVRRYTQLKLRVETKVIQKIGDEEKEKVRPVWEIRKQYIQFRRLEVEINLTEISYWLGLKKDEKALFASKPTSSPSRMESEEKDSSFMLLPSEEERDEMERNLFGSEGSETETPLGNKKENKKTSIQEFLRNKYGFATLREVSNLSEKKLGSFFHNRILKSQERLAEEEGKTRWYAKLIFLYFCEQVTEKAKALRKEMPSMEEKGRLDRNEVVRLMESVDRRRTMPGQPVEYTRIEENWSRPRPESERKFFEEEDRQPEQTILKLPSITNLFGKLVNLEKEKKYQELDPEREGKVLDERDGRIRVGYEERKGKRTLLSEEERREVESSTRDRTRFITTRVERASSRSTTSKRSEYVKLGKYRRYRRITQKRRVHFTKRNQEIVKERCGDLTDQRKAGMKRLKESGTEKLSLQYSGAIMDRKDERGFRQEVYGYYEEQVDVDWIEAILVWIYLFQNPWKLYQENPQLVNPIFPEDFSIRIWNRIVTDIQERNKVPTWVKEDVEKYTPRLRIEDHPWITVDYTWISDVTSYVGEVEKEEIGPQLRARSEWMKVNKPKRLAKRWIREGMREANPNRTETQTGQIQKNEFWKTEAEKSRHPSLRAGVEGINRIPLPWDAQSPGISVDGNEPEPEWRVVMGAGIRPEPWTTLNWPERNPTHRSGNLVKGFEWNQLRKDELVKEVRKSQRIGQDKAERIVDKKLKKTNTGLRIRYEVGNYGIHAHPSVHSVHAVPNDTKDTKDRSRVKSGGKLRSQSVYIESITRKLDYMVSVKRMKKARKAFYKKEQVRRDSIQNTKGTNRVDAGVVERTRLENEQSIRLVGSNPTQPGWLRHPQDIRWIA